MLTSRLVLLVANADPGIRRLLRRDFTKAGLSVITVDNARSLLDQAQRGNPDLVITSAQLGDMTAVALVSAIRRVTAAPILVLLQAATSLARLEILDAGADDCLDEPFLAAELAARVRRMIHRVGGVRAYRQLATQLGNLEVDTVERKVRLNGSIIMLTRKEFDLLALLASPDGTSIPHETILRIIWDTDDAGARRNLRRVVSTLRAKLETNPRSPAILKSERGKGYRLVVQHGMMDSDA